MAGRGIVSWQAVGNQAEILGIDCKTIEISIVPRAHDEDTWLATRLQHVVLRAASALTFRVPRLPRRLGFAGG